MINILLKDKHILALEKPCGVLCEASQTEDESILTIASSQENIPELFPIHRLDRNVSGLLLVAKNKATAGKFSAMISERSVGKEYLAVVHGKPSEQSGIYKDLLFKDSSSGKSYVTDRMRKGVKDASLEYRVLASRDSEDGELSLVRIKLHTGRTHQIRVQFSSRHTPLFGDGKYGSHTNRGMIALCSARLTFVHPFSKKDTDLRLLPKIDDYPWSLFEDALDIGMFDTEILQD